ncbi:hypothetical protein GSI_01057 [Ganoderma sinense ZZ0214-1]|uniref:E3 ubiquitin-protein ligase RNF220 middle domain-containing protein n=1 Tax=Ganoderma sinense ZZ0214-1 TaxID=1077348 RepID=A0A2G8SUD4_9APHY|nr:hypothetical protein GSI_01057 [Ganoderma sinense ZZ0214-1]
MCSRRASKGKKRAAEETLTEDEQVGEASFPNATGASQSARSREKQPALPIKKPKRAETRRCPVCEEVIPIRLLGKHAELEAERLEEIIRCIGSTEVLGEAEPEDSSSARTRRSAVKARQSLKPGSSSTAGAMLEETMKTLRTLKKRRKERHARLREITKEDEDEAWWGRGAGGREGQGQECPVCAKFVKGDMDVVEAHVDSCLVFFEEEQRRDRSIGRRGSTDLEMDADVDVDGDEGHYGVMDGVSMRGTGFDIRNRNDQDVDDEIDVDGEDEAVFGAPQFTEQDVLALPADPGEVDGAESDSGTDVEIDVDDTTAPGGSSASTPERDPKKGLSLRDLVAEGKVIRHQVEDAKQAMNEVMGVGDAEKVDLAVELARRGGDQAALVKALESKVKLLEARMGTTYACQVNGLDDSFL